MELSQRSPVLLSELPRGSVILDHAIAYLAHLITQAIAWLGYPGIALMMALESTLVPIPSEIVMPFAGYLASAGRFSLIGAAVAGALGCNVGSTVIYYVGAVGGRPFAEKYGRYFFLTRRKIAKVEDYFHRWGGVTLLITRMMPLLPVVVSLPAGFARMPMWKFQLYTFIGCFIWCFALAALGYEFGLAWQSQPWVKAAIHWLDIAMVACVVLAVAWFAWRRFAAKKSR
ncbi:MAG TPA: DedA family protein [Rhizomicrobium sp.]|nr:DedA family protein [Rhizomicrobium sp.]